MILWKHQEVPIILINILTYNFINLPIKNFKQVEANKRNSLLHRECWEI